MKEVVNVCRRQNKLIHIIQIILMVRQILKDFHNFYRINFHRLKIINLNLNLVMYYLNYLNLKIHFLRMDQNYLKVYIILKIDKINIKNKIIYFKNLLINLNYYIHKVILFNLFNHQLIILNYQSTVPRYQKLVAQIYKKMERQFSKIRSLIV